MLSERLERVRTRIQQACQRSGRDPASITLVCVTKTVPVPIIHEAVSLGVADLGENRVQETREKRLLLTGSGLRWHLIGHLQRNKAKEAVEVFDVVHSVDSAVLADELERQAVKRRAYRDTLEVFVQVNVSGETTKFGCHPDQTFTLTQHVAQLPHLRLCGLMALAPFCDNPEEARPHFRRLRELRDELSQSLSYLTTLPLALSMGMSNDFEVALEEGADLVRVGTAIFGSRT